MLFSELKTNIYVHLMNCFAVQRVYVFLFLEDEDEASNAGAKKQVHCLWRI